MSSVLRPIQADLMAVQECIATLVEQQKENVAMAEEICLVKANAFVQRDKQRMTLFELQGLYAEVSRVRRSI